MTSRPAGTPGSGRLGPAILCKYGPGYAVAFPRRPRRRSPPATCLRIRGRAVGGRRRLLYSCGTMTALDTSPTARERQRDVFRRMTPEERVALAAEMSDEIRSVSEAGIRHRHPAWTEDDVRAELAAIVLGRAHAGRVRARRSAAGR